MSSGSAGARTDVDAGASAAGALWRSQPSKHVFALGGRIIAGPIKANGGSGWIPVVYFIVWSGLFVVYMRYVAAGVWLVLGPIVALVSLLLLRNAAYSDPGVLPRGWQIKQVRPSSFSPMHIASLV